MLEDVGAPDGELLACGEQLPQGLQAAGDEEISFGIGPAGEDVVGAHGIPRREVDDDDAPEELLAFFSAKRGEPPGEEIKGAVKELPFGIEHPEGHGAQPRQVGDERVEDQAGGHRFARPHAAGGNPAGVHKLGHGSQDRLAPRGLAEMHVRPGGQAQIPQEPLRYLPGRADRLAGQ